MKNERPTLIVLTPGFPKDEADSSCLPSQQLLVRQLNQQYPGLRIIVLAFDYPFLHGTYQWHDNAVISFNSRKKPKLRRLFILLSVWRMLNSLRRKYVVVGVLSFWCGLCALIGSRFGKRYGIKHFCWILGQDAKKQNHYVKWINPLAGELMAISDFIQKEFEKNHGIKPQHIIPNGVDPRAFLLGNPDRDLDVLGAGSLIPLKQYKVFVEIVGQLKEQFPDITAMLCGKGPEEDELGQLIVEKKLQNHLCLEGELPQPEILNRMKRSKLFLHTSNYEGFSTVCIEALYAGATVISFCKPMDEAVPNWHIVDSKEAMLEKAVEVLKNLPGGEPVLHYTMSDSAKKIMELLHYSE